MSDYIVFAAGEVITLLYCGRVGSFKFCKSSVRRCYDVKEQ